MLLRGVLMVRAPGAVGDLTDRSSTRKSEHISSRSPTNETSSISRSYKDTSLGRSGSPGCRGIPESMQQQLDAEGPDDRRLSRRSSMSAKKLGRDGMLHMLEKPGSCLGV